jgi:hypothetical protein
MSNIGMLIATYCCPYLAERNGGALSGVHPASARSTIVFTIGGWNRAHIMNEVCPVLVNRKSGPSIKQAV